MPWSQNDEMIHCWRNDQSNCNQSTTWSCFCALVSMHCIAFLHTLCYHRMTYQLTVLHFMTSPPPPTTTNTPATRSAHLRTKCSPLEYAPLGHRKWCKRNRLEQQFAEPRRRGLYQPDKRVDEQRTSGLQRPGTSGAEHIPLVVCGV